MLSGLTDPVLGSQRIFRAVLDAMTHPGRVVSVPGPLERATPLHPATTAICLALVDMDTPLWLDPMARRPSVLEGLRFHCGCLIVHDPERARFAVIVDAERMPPLSIFDAGTDDYPDRSATVLVQVNGLTAGTGKRLSGPGIAGEERLAVDGVRGRFWDELRDNHGRFPRGVDVVLAANSVITALPRTTRVEG